MPLLCPAVPLHSVRVGTWRPRVFISVSCGSLLGSDPHSESVNSPQAAPRAMASACAESEGEELPQPRLSAPWC